jgi:hypothetical protein
VLSWGRWRNRYDLAGLDFMGERVGIGLADLTCREGAPDHRRQLRQL